MDDAQLRTVWQQRQFRDSAARVGQSLAAVMKPLARRVRQLAKLAEVWDELIPEPIREHTALECFQRGTLTVLVDSAAHRFQLQTLLNAGLLAVIRARFSGALQKVRLLPGQFYAVDISRPETEAPEDG